ncbi:peptidase of plants and bacteria-domain-containing protein [Lasiosphaeria hispida]|uniref:Peptidase of plants and bacteria-domain-containing protein n=1 Tax=Lasiosphaeria hispida TaxID=260671 RepID=A0AAJ0HIS3_9PEZI|nr:peptidase of plants and bacteria-domain-containing protein [Lasiosphaeria hispida]
MTLLPLTTRAPKPGAVFTLPTSSTDDEKNPSDPTPSAIPLPDLTATKPTGPDKPPSPTRAPPAPEERDSRANHRGGGSAHFPQPKLRFEIRDVCHPGAAKFLGAVNIGSIFSVAVANVQRCLYRSPGDPHTHVPPTRSVTLILRDMGGVAYTTGTDLDSDHKEIHFSLSYINGIPAPRLTAEITGVLTHELVHCYQWDALNSCPGGLVEGIADWVRLNCDLSPPHWKREIDGGWDRGYQHTAYFLQYLVDRFGEGTVREINEKLRRRRYEAKPFWTELLGRPVEQLWSDYASAGEG